MTGQGTERRRRSNPADWVAHLAEVYVSADPRWLGIFRIAFGVILLADLGRRWAEAREYYTNEGFLPNHFSLFRPMGDHLFSLFHAFSTLGEIHVVFALTALVFLSFTLGYKTRLCQVLSAVLMTSLNSRNLMVENGGDVVVDLLAITTVFLPLGRRLSVDALIASMRGVRETTASELNDRKHEPEQPFVSLMVLFLLLQLAVVYFFNAVHKSGVGWKDGSAIHYFLQQDRIVTRFGIFLREHLPFGVLRQMSYGTLVVEHALPALILSPIFFRWTRRIAWLLAIALHGGIALCSRLGPFSYVMVTFFLLFFGEQEVRFAARWFGRELRKRTVIYDADCGICLWLARLAKRLDPFERLTFVSNESPTGLPEGVSAELTARTLVVVDARGRVHEQEQAVRSLLSALPFGVLLGGWLALPGLRQLARRAYVWVAEHRLELSSAVGLGACGVTPATSPAAAQRDEATEETLKQGEEQAESEAEAEQPARPRRTFRGDRLAFYGFAREVMVALVAAILLTQIGNDNPWLTQRMRVHRSAWMVGIVDRLRLIEGWGMFAPEPPYDDGRLVVDARTADGRKLDPFTGAAPVFDTYAPKGWGHEQFWCDYNLKLSFPWFSQHRQFLKDYLLRWHEYEHRPNDKLVAFDVWWVHDKSPKPGEQKPQTLAPQKLVSFGTVKDSGAREYLPRSRRPAPSPRPSASGAVRSP